MFRVGTQSEAKLNRFVEMWANVYAALAFRAVVYGATSLVCACESGRGPLSCSRCSDH